ncbi:MAG: DUF4935 domain-containing protein [Nitrospirae bacterium]|nr:DUF4935 domain-containing protein [Nitrospirota bacterium]
MKKLLFIDSNIYLDFYRVKTEIGLSLISHIDSIRDNIIITSQVEMEFKKNRQPIILDTINYLKAPEQIARPGILSEDKSLKALQADIKSAQTRIKNLKLRLQRILQDPTKHDPVYKVAQRIFMKDDDLNLKRDKKERKLIRPKALRRFLAGYPPRKKNDTTIGDAFNWEWIIYIASQKKANVLIASRDTDYGVTFGDKTFINDWLLQEFRDRVSRKCKVELYSKLSDCLKTFKVKVTSEEIKEEDDLITKRNKQLKDLPDDWNEILALREAIRQLKEQLRGLKGPSNNPNDSDDA